MMIVDCFTFYNEVGLLALRLETLKDAVDRFVIVEMSVTHGGLRKGFVLEHLLETLPVPSSRIVYVRVDDAPSVEPGHEVERWKLENFQRNAIQRGLDRLNVRSDDLVLFSDLDEIPDPAAIAFTAGRLGSDETAVFCQLYRKFFINAISKDYTTSQCWLGTIAARASKVCTTTPQELRRGGAFPRAAFLWTRGRAENTLYVERGGWHLTYFGGPAATEIKAQSIVEGAMAHCANLFDVPEPSRHNWCGGRTAEIVAWRESLDAVILPATLEAPGLHYLPKPLVAEAHRWEWLWWLREPLD